MEMNWGIGAMGPWNHANATIGRAWGLISMNGGAGNPTGSVQALALLDQDFDTLTAAPASGYGQDGSTAVLGAWWDYDLLAHRVTTKTNIIYVLFSSQGAYFKLMMLDYYDSAGTPAAISLKYAPLAPP